MARGELHRHWRVRDFGEFFMPPTEQKRIARPTAEMPLVYPRDIRHHVIEIRHSIAAINVPLMLTERSEVEVRSFTRIDRVGVNKATRAAADESHPGSVKE